MATHINNSLLAAILIQFILEILVHLQLKLVKIQIEVMRFVTFNDLKISNLLERKLSIGNIR